MDSMEWRGQALFHISAIIKQLGEYERLIHDQNVGLTRTAEC